MMLWNILRPRLWELRHYWQEMKLVRRILTALGLLVVAIMLSFGFVLMIFGLSGARGENYLADLLPTGFFTMAFFMIIQLGDTLNQLYLTPDLFWLNQAPMRKLDIFLAKLIECTFSLWLPAIFLMGMLVALGVAQGVSYIYYPLAVCIVLAFLVLATVTGMIIIMLLARIIPARRMRELLPALMGVVSVGGILGQRVLLNRVSSNSLSIEILNTSLQSTSQMALLSVLVCLAAGLWAAAGYYIFSAVNEQAINAIQIAQPPKVRRISGPTSPALSGGIHFFESLFPTDQLNVMLKDWTTLRRDPQRATNLLLTPLMMVIFMLPSFGWKDFSTIGYWIMLFYAALFCMNSGNIALSAFTQEARVFSFIYRSPISMRSVMLAKLWAAWIPTAALWMVVLGFGAYFMHLALWQWTAMVAMVLVCLAGTCITMVAISALSANLSVISPRSRLVGPMAWVAMLVGFFWNFCVLGLTISLIFILESNTALVSGALGSFNLPAIPAFIPPLAAGISLFGLLIASIPIVLFWTFGLKRLKNWEQV